MKKIVYDIETFPNCFLFGAEVGFPEMTACWEYSWRKNEMPDLFRFLTDLKSNGYGMVGFNNLGFDYPVIHWMLDNQDHILSGIFTPYEIYLKAKEIIDCPWDDRFRHIIWDQDHYIPQIDLYKIHHFDNPSRATSLKVLEFNMQRDRVRELPFEPGKFLDWDECDTLVSYLMDDDIPATVQFMNESLSQIKFREELTEKYDDHYMNCSDPKIGEKFIMMKMQEQIPGFNKQERTKRDKIPLKDVIFPYIQFEHPEFNRILNWFKDQVIPGHNTKGIFKDASATVNGFQFDFGTGGIHGSIESSIVESDADYIIEDWDVASYYPNIGIKNEIYPEHLGKSFCMIYEDVYHQRQQYPKGTPENAMLKLALNAVYGKSNSQFSCFYDPQYTMAITINGQLMLCMLAEQLMKGAELIQINTDGLTIRYDRKDKAWVHSVCDWWQKITKLELENAEYRRMFIRDVNSYIAEYTDGKVKRKGAYEYDLGWEKNHSAKVIAKAAEAALLYDQDIRELIEIHTDYHDFMLRTKVPRSSKLVGVDYHSRDNELPNVSRYFISVMGLDLKKVMPPTPSQLAKDPAAPDRRIGINTGWKVTVCNQMSQFNPDDIEFDYYVKEAEKLVNPLRR